MNSTADILINASAEQDFEKCLDSAVIQGGFNRIIVADRLNSPKIREIIESKDDTRIRYLDCAGQTPMQTCLTLALTSDAVWLKYICNNEILAPKCLENLLISAENFENITMSFGGMKIIHPDGSSRTMTYDFPEYINGQDYLFNIYNEIPFRTLSNTLVRKSVFSEINIRLLPDRMYSIHGVISMYAMVNGNLTYVNEVTVTAKKDAGNLPDAETMADNLEHILVPCNYAAQKLPALKKRVSTLKSQLLSQEINELVCELAENQRYGDAFKVIAAAARIRFASAAAAVFSPCLYKPIVRKIYRKLSKKRKDG